MKYNQTEPWAVGFLAGAVSWLLMFSLATCGSCAPTMSYVPTLLRGDDMQARMAVRVEVTCFSGDIFTGTMGLRGGYGSGVIVDERHVLTAAHVVHCDGEAVVNVITFEDRRYRVVVERSDADDDVARLVVLRERDFGLDVVPPAIGVAIVDSTACVVSAYPERARACGRVTQSGTFVRHLALTRPGNSGGGLYSDGRLVGLVSTRQFCSPIEVLTGEASCGGSAARVTLEWLR